MYMRALLVGIVLSAGISATRADDSVPRADLNEVDRARVTTIVQPTTDFSKAEPFEFNSAGAATSLKKVNRDGFSQFSASLGFAEQEQFKLGNALFRKLWVSSPSSTLASDGLGPLFNARSCQSCHIKDGRGHPPLNANDTAISMFLRLSVEPVSPEEILALEQRAAQTIPHPIYGGQLQNFAIPGHAGEGNMQIAYTEQEVVLEDGIIVSLRHPTYSIASANYGEVGDIMLSPRVAPQMPGMGLLEAIHPSDILAKADPDDQDGDAISGRPNWVKLPDGELALGRFGWKATNPTVRAQSAGAFAGDIGISSPDAKRAWGDCTINQPTCRNAPTGVQTHLGDSEAPDPVLDLVTFYSSHVAVPARRDVENPQVLRGKEQFYTLGCTSCHTPKYVTRRDVDDPVLAFQLIWPYTDLLLHDLGDGLADHRPDGDADGYEWRTPPLWGIGLTKLVSDHTLFLHDGRARSLTEAILWHGGEAQSARDGFAALSSKERTDLISFLESL